LSLRAGQLELGRPGGGSQRDDRAWRSIGVLTSIRMNGADARWCAPACSRRDFAWPAA